MAERKVLLPVMDRMEAYELLTREMRKLAERIASTPARSHDETVEFDLQGVSSPRYSVELKVERTSENRLAILGKIHDNCSYQFALLEERLEFEFPAEE